MNTQPVSPLAGRGTSMALHVHSIFNTIQGEGPFAGCPATFIRLTGCNLQCPMCDTEYTSKDTVYDAHRLAEDAYSLAVGKKLIVITGGEPFRQNLRTLVHTLLYKGCIVQIETNGTLPPTISEEDLIKKGLWIVCSPKTGKVSPALTPHIRAYKYVMNVGSIDTDGLPMLALGHPAAIRVARPPATYKGRIYLQAADSGNEQENKANLDAVVTSCLLYGYTLCLQQHKLLGLE